MNNLYISEDMPILNEVLAAYDFPSTLMGAVRYGQGHINDTFCVICQPQDGDCIRFILQGLSSAAFPHPEELMENMAGITAYLREKIIANGGDPLRETLTLIQTKDGKDYYTDKNGKVWRLTPFIENTDCWQKATPELFEASARAFGRFQYMLQGYPAHTLHEPIARFHDTENRFEKFLAALEADKLGRAAQVADEIRFVMDRKADCSVAMQALRDGKLPLRVTHNDTKLNNILIDRLTGEGICVIDLDTTMPGLSINDFGDSIRTGAASAAEDEADLSKVHFLPDMFKAYAAGFIKGTGGALTARELEMLPDGGYIITLEQAIRFLGDYLDGDTYYHTDYPDHNLVRARTQLKLVAEMEACMPELREFVAGLLCD